MKSFADIIRGLREDKDLKQSEMAILLHVTQQQYSRYENGVSEPSLRTLEILADYYNLSADFLMGRTKCEQSLEGLNKIITADYSVGQLISDVMSLDNDGRKYILECISLQKLKAKNK